MIRVLIVDDHPVVRRGLDELLSIEPDIEVVGTAADADEAAVLHTEHAPDVVLMDIAMPGDDGVAATRRLLAERSSTRVVILTTFAEQDKIIAALAAGASGYLLKDAEPEELIVGIHAAVVGESPISPRAARELLAPPAALRPSLDLSARETEVLKLVAGGRSNREIAVELGIAEKTVKAHLTRVFNTIGVSDRTQAALWAASNGL